MRNRAGRIRLGFAIAALGFPLAGGSGCNPDDAVTETISTIAFDLLGLS